MVANKIVAVVDDDPAILEVIKIILEDGGFEVLTISGGAIVKQLKAAQPHLILLDMCMSGTDGRVVAKLLKQDTATTDIPIVIISAHNEAENMAQEAGADGFLPKPFDIDQLVAVAKSYID